jgi:cupin-like protein
MSIVEPPRIHRPARDLVERHLRDAEPFIATGVTEGWPAVPWDFAALDGRCGNARVPVERYTSDDARIGGWTTEEMSLREYLERLARNESVYLSTVLVNRYLPRLAPELPYPACISPERTPANEGYYIFIGDRRRSETHFHPALQAVLVNLHGRKRLGLYPPTETDHLYPHPWYQILGPERVPAFNWSRVLPGREAQFPAIRRLSGYECVLEPGEMLFIPVHWWHWAESLGPSVSVTLLFQRLRGDRFSNRLALRSYCGSAQYVLRAGARTLLARWREPPDAARQDRP